MPFKHTTTDRYRPDPPHGRLAQLVERMTVNHDDVSSKLTFPPQTLNGASSKQAHSHGYHLCRKVAGEILDSWGLSFTLSLLTWGSKRLIRIK